MKVLTDNTNTRVKRIVKIIALHKDRLVIVKQKRNTSIYTYELPGGKVEENETVYDGALRELKEETGLAAQKLMELGSITLPSGDLTTTLFFARDFHEQTFQELDDDEEIEIIEIDAEEALTKVINGEWKDARLGIGLIWAKAKGLIDKV